MSHYSLLLNAKAVGGVVTLEDGSTFYNPAARVEATNIVVAIFTAGSCFGNR